MRIFFYSAILLLPVALNGQQSWQWAYPVWGAGNDGGNAISTDAAGNSYITGYFYGNATFGSHILTSTGSGDIFIARYNSAGTCLWATSSGTPGYDQGTGIDFDGAGNSYVTGILDGKIFLSKYDALGNLIWNRLGTSVMNNNGRAVSTDSLGNSWITGYLAGGTTIFGTDTLSGTGGFITKYDSSGNVIFAKKLGSGVGGIIDLYGITNDRAGNAYVTGLLQGQQMLGTQTFVSINYKDIVTIKVDASGNFSWLAQAPSNSFAYDRSHAITCDGQNGVYICGRIEGITAFGTDTLYGTPSSMEIFLAKYDTAGNAIWAKQSVGGDNFTDGLAVACDRTGYIYVTGQFSSDIVFGNVGLLNNNTGVNAYVVAFDQMGTCQFAIPSTGPNAGTHGYGISTDGSAGTYIVGISKGNAVFGTDTLWYGASVDVFVAKLQGGKNGIPNHVSLTQVFLSNIPGAFVLSLGDDMSFNEESVFVLFDVTGRVVKSTAVTSAITLISNTELSAGVYLWQVSSSGNIIAAGKAIRN